MTLTETWIPKAPPLREDPPGTVRIGKSRVTLDVLIGEYRNGLTAEQIAEAYDTLRISDIHAVLSYYLENRSKVDAYLDQRVREAEELRKHFEEKSSFAEFRAKLLERRRQGEVEGK